jgi:DNA mismatch repair ATPase MutL
VRQTMSRAISNAIEGTGDTVPKQDERNAESAIPDPSTGTTSGEGTDTPLATPEHPSSDDRLASEEPRPVPTSKRTGTSNDNGGGSISSDSLFEASESPRISALPPVVDTSERQQHRGKHIEGANTPLSRADSSARVERGELPCLRDLRVVGQIASGYVLVDEPMAAWIVDQHVAHERALLDRLTYPEEERMPSVQTLLVPEVVRLPPRDAAEVADSLEELSVFGFEVEPFGKDSFRINGVISTLAERGDVADAFRDAVSAMKGTAPGMGREERILATIACHSAVKLGDKLSYEEMKALIQEWLSSRYPATCPHGRSICYRLEHKEIARKLDRH